MKEPGADGSELTDRLASLHASAFDAAWSAEVLADLMSQPGVHAVMLSDGFVLVRVVADEAEILTLAVHPQARRAGLATALVGDAVVWAKACGAARLFLEVAEDNAAARGLYSKLGFSTVGHRAAYYARPGGQRVDALIMALDLPDPLPSAPSAPYPVP